ncbi:kinesin-like protein KIN-6 isoform X2 [Punica granatum]|uniref:Kinesin-like protein KIN-6 isoform X2 n=1 Tax=Punica granatum TaxID=22663 RepID=A0A6P8E1U3_PUNGR|nr:kinesin-like protein KIN-6 isoform X2 [Punica granatum]
MQEESRRVESPVSPPPCPGTVTVRRNPHRRARPTPKTGLRSSSKKPEIPNVPSFPIQDILAIDLPPNPTPAPAPAPAPVEAPISENLKVYVRIRPISIELPESVKDSSKRDVSSRYRVKHRVARSSPKKRDATAKKKSCEICVTATSASSVSLSPPKDLQEAKRIKEEVFEGFSHVFRTDSSQNEVYERMVKPLVEDFLRGTSGMLAALGPSGSGKTHTVFGSPRDPGIVPRVLQQIFGQTDGNTNSSQRSFYLSMFQICSERGKAEKAFDLSNGVELSMHQSTIKGLQEVVVTDVGHAESLIEAGMLRRATAMTNSNSQSSRSQCIINIRDVGSRHNGEVDVPMSNANLTFVDFAGAEREKKTGNQGERLLESNFINNTSMVFGLCLRSLLEHQKNPKKPLPKHFQNSLLTRYLRDYLEGKKRMALILTVKPGGEDYLETSQFLQQAAPFMKIKFNNVEETSGVVRNKRQTTAMPRTEHAKRVKISRTKASVTEEEKSRSAKDENREDRVLLHFARAMWNVLNEYKRKLKVAESEIESLRENYANETIRTAELEKELKNLKEGCNCINIYSTEAPLAQRYANTDLDASASPGADEPSISESSDEVERKVHSCLLQTPECNMQNERLTTFIWNDNMKHAGDSDPPQAQGHLDPNTHTRDHLVLMEDESVKVVSSLCGLDSFDVRAQEEYDVSVREPAFDVSSSSQSPDKAFVKQDKEYVKTESEQPCGNEDSCGEDSELDSSRNMENLKDTGGSSEPHVLVRKDSCSTVELDDLKSNGYEVSSEQPAEVNKDVASTQVSSSANEDSGGDLEDSKLDNSRGVENLGATDRLEGFADVGSSFQPNVLVRKDSCSTVELDDLKSDGEEVSSDQPAEVNKYVASTQVSSSVNQPEKLLKSESSPKLPNQEKPRRRLLPASSVLLRNMSYWNIDDETEKPKGNRGGKKKEKDAKEELRTKGSATLLRLLKGDLL